MADDPFDAISLTRDLDPAARRRLWLISRFVGRCALNEIDSVISVAARIEAFIVGGSASGAGRESKQGEAASTADESVSVQMPRPTVRQEPLVETTSAKLEKTDSLGCKDELVRHPLLDREARARFIQEAARNPDNRHLARKFDLSVRQAHAIRVALSKYINDARRNYELQVQDDPLRNNINGRSTMDDVIQYLRQMNDVVIPHGGHYVVNSKLSLTAEQLVERANGKRRERNEEPLTIMGADALYEASAD